MSDNQMTGNQPRDNQITGGPPLPAIGLLTGVWGATAIFVDIEWLKILAALMVVPGLLMICKSFYDMVKGTRP